MNFRFFRPSFDDALPHIVPQHTVDDSIASRQRGGGKLDSAYGVKRHRSRILNKHNHHDGHKEDKKKEKKEGGEGEVEDHEDNMKEMSSDVDDDGPPPPHEMEEEDEAVEHHETTMPSYSPHYVAYSSSSSPSPSSAGIDGSVFHSKTNKEGKSRKISAGICAKRLEIAYNETMKANLEYPGLFPVETPEDVTKLCAFIPPNANFGCPFYYLPVFDGIVDYFPKGVEEYVALDTENPTAFTAAASIALYCSCYQGYDLGCINELPATFQEGIEDGYCEFAGVWNGDFNGEDVALSPTLLDCGCFWISEVTTEVGKCPGVDLGNFFVKPSTPSDGVLGIFSLLP